MVRGTAMVPRTETALGLLWLGALIAVAQVRDHVGDVGQLLLEVALVGLQPREQLLPVRERPAEMDSPAPVPVMVVVRCHLHSS